MIMVLWRYARVQQRMSDGSLASSTVKVRPSRGSPTVGDRYLRAMPGYGPHDGHGQENRPAGSESDEETDGDHVVSLPALAVMAPVVAGLAPDPAILEGVGVWGGIVWRRPR